MSLAAPQVRLLALTDRNNTIDRQLSHYALEKSALSRDTRQVTMDYQNALNTKRLKLSFNSGVSYADLSYAALMRPNSNNTKSPMLITDASGRVVIDEKYKKYAEMISPSGAVGGNYSGETRDKILKELTGVSSDKLEEDTNTKNIVKEKADAKYNAKKVLESIPYKDIEADEFIRKYLNKSVLGITDSKVASYSGLNNVDSVIQKLKSGIEGKNYFSSEALLYFDKACEDAKQDIIAQEAALQGDNSSTSPNVAKAKQNAQLRSRNSNDAKMGFIWGIVEDYYNNNEQHYEVSTDDFISTVVGAFKEYLGGSDTIRVMVDNKGKGTQADYESALAAYNKASQEYDDAIAANTVVLDASDTTLINYYDQLFTSIVDNGWVYDPTVKDNDYLNQMFQNNQYFITSIDKTSDYNPDTPESLKEYYYTYTTDLAANTENIYAVNDSDLQNQALVEYEYKKQVLSDKESRIDQRMQNLKTEKSAITNMMETLKKFTKDGIEARFNLWG